MDDLIKVKLGKLVEEPGHLSYVSNPVLGKIFKIYKTKVRQLYMDRFEKNRLKKVPLLERLQLA